MAYELAQNARALTLLEWDDIDFDTCTATILLDRNKDRTVTVPLSDDLMFMLNEQRKVWGWQRLVAPNPISRRGTVTAFSHLRLSDCFADIRKKAGLPDNLKLRDIHLTGIKQMLDAGVDTMQILTVIGRDRLSLLQKYVDDNISHSPKAVDALERRMAHIKQKE
jgi:integrase